MSDFVLRAQEKWILNDRNLHISLSDLDECIRFSHFIDSAIDHSGILDIAEAESKYTVNMSEAMANIGSKFSQFGLEWVEKPAIHASSKSIYMRAQIKLFLKPDHSEYLHIPLYYTYDNWKLLEKGNVESEFLTVLSNSIIQAHKNLDCMFINPQNYNKFPVYNIEVIDYAYDQWNIVLEIISDQRHLGLHLYYTWDPLKGSYKRTGKDSELAKKHHKYSDLIDRLSK